MTITTLRPSSDGSKDGVSYSTGTTAFALVDDAPADDATYIYAASGLQWPDTRIWLNLPDGTPTIDTNNRVKQMRIRARVRLNAADGGRSASIRMDTRDARDNKGIGFTTFSTANSSATVELTGPWNTKPTPASGSEVNQGDLNNYQLYAAWYHTGGTVKSNLRISELYLDVDVRVRGVLSAVVASQTDITNQPLISWTWTKNADGDIQKAYQVRIFSAAQYGAAGFNADSSASVWDSGKTYGDVQQVRVGQGGTGAASLDAGVTYKAYVKTAQDFNGQDWWVAAWQNSSAFTISVVGLPAPTLTVTPDPSVPWLRNVIQLQGNLNNLGPNLANFEGGLGDSGFNWTANLNCTVTQSSTVTANNGTFTMRLSSTAGGDMAAQTPGSTLAWSNVKAGTTYTALASFRTGVSARSCRIEIVWLNRAGGTISTTVGGNVTDGTGGWTQATASAAAPALAVKAQLIVRVLATGGAAELHYVDTVSMHTGTSTVWSPGGLAQDAAAGVVEYSWATVSPVNLIHPHLHSGGDWFIQTSVAAAMVATGADSSVYYDTRERYHGQGSFRWQVNNTTSKLYIGASTDLLVGETPSFEMIAVPGRTYTFSLYAKADASFSSQLVLQPMDTYGASVGSPVNGGGITVTTSWQRFQVSVTVPAGAVYVRPNLDNTGSVTERYVWVDAMQWEVGSAATALSQPGGTAVVWNPVRGAAIDEVLYQSSPMPDQVLTVMDHEVPPGYTVAYRAYNTYAVPDTDYRLTSPYTPHLHTLMDPPTTRVWTVKNPQLPLHAMMVKVANFNESQHEESATFYPLRPTTWQKPNQRPVVISDFLGGFDGELEIVLSSPDEFRLLCTLMGTLGTLWVTFPDFGGRHIRVTDRSWTRRAYRPPTESWLRTVRVPFVEVDRPGVPVA